MAEREDPKYLDLGKLLDPKKVNFELKSAETPDEIRSRLKLAELEAEHQHRTQEAEDTHKRRTNWWVHIFVMAIVAVAFLASPTSRWRGTRTVDCRTRQWASSRPSSRAGWATSRARGASDCDTETLAAKLAWLAPTRWCR